VNPAIASPISFAAITAQSTAMIAWLLAPRRRQHQHDGDDRDRTESDAEGQR
jgi:hypothetical protein